MALSVTHKFTDPHGDGPDTSLVRPSNWNDTHAIAGTLDAAQFPALTGDVTTSAGSLATTIAANAVTFAKMAVAAQGLNFVRNVQTAAYALTNGDKGTAIALGGSAFYTLTIGAATGFDSNFSCTVLNEDAGRAKWISLSGGTSFYLWPQQSFILYRSNTKWRTIGAPAQWQLTSALTIN